MKAYIDLMILNQILQGIGYFFLLENIFLEKENLKKKIILTIISSLRVLAIYLNTWIGIILVILYDVIMFFIFFKKKMISRIAIYYAYIGLEISLELLFFKSFLSFRNLNIVIIDMKGGIIVLLQPIFYAFIKISSLIADKLYLLRDYKIDVLISSGVEDRVVKAYFDSGNTLCIKKNPVIFIKKGTMKFSEKDEIQVNVDMTLPYFPEKVYRVMVTSGIKKQSYFALAFVVKKEADFYGCDCLYNAMLRR